MSVRDTYQGAGVVGAQRLRNATAIIIAAVLVLAPLKPGFILPLFATNEDLSLEIGVLVGAMLGASVYWSLPRRAGYRHRAGARMRLFVLMTFLCAMVGALMLSAASLLLSDEPVMGAPFGDASVYALWCSIVVTAAMLVIQDPNRRRVGRSRRSSRAEVMSGGPGLAPLAMATLAPALRAERDCPWCAERILARAKVCKFCGHDVDVAS